MSFATAFLDTPASADRRDEVIAHLAEILQATSPRPDLPPGLPNVARSSLAFGARMNWALADAFRKEQITAEIRACVSVFEPRLTRFGIADLREDDRTNSLGFTLEGTLVAGGVRAPLAIATEVSFFDDSARVESAE